jgi:hypothetical protein
MMNGVLLDLLGKLVERDARRFCCCALNCFASGSRARRGGAEKEGEQRGQLSKFSAARSRESVGISDRQIERKIGDVFESPAGDHHLDEFEAVGRTHFLDGVEEFWQGEMVDAVDLAGSHRE